MNSVNRAADSLAAMHTGEQTVEALATTLRDSFAHKGLAGVVAVCADFAHAAHSTLRSEATTATLKAVAVEANTLMLGRAKEMAMSNAEFKASEK